MEVIVEETPIMQQEPSLGEVILNLWQARLFILGGLFFAALGCMIFFVTAVPQYKTEMIVAPITRPGTPENTAFVMDHVLQNFVPGGSADFMRFETIITEPTIATRLMEDDYILESVTRARRFNFLLSDTPQNGAELSVWLGKNLRLENIQPTGLKRLVVLHHDEAFGRYLLHKLYLETDNLIRSAAAAKTKKRVLWLKQKLGETDHPQHRKVITDLLMDQEQISMILAVEEPYAAMIAEPASVGVKPVWPRRGFVIPIFALVGMFLGYMLFSLRRALRSS